MRLLLHPLKLRIQVDGGILYGRVAVVCFASFLLFLHQMREDRVVNGEPIQVVDLLDELQAHGASNAAVAEWLGVYVKNSSRQGVQKVWPQWMRILGIRCRIS